MKKRKGDVEKMLDEHSQEIGLNNHGQMKHSTSRNKVPLKSFLFGIKLKKQRQSAIVCVNPNLQKQYGDLAEADDAPI